MQRNKILKFNWVKLDRLLVKQIQLDEDFELLNVRKLTLTNVSYNSFLMSKHC